MKDLNIQIAIKIYEYEELNAADRELLDAARQATYRSYAPYSHFSVGAAARLANNIIVTVRCVFHVIKQIPTFATANQQIPPPMRISK